MSTKYKATEADKAYFITITTVGWIDVFTRLSQKELLVASLRHCQDEKGLEIYAYCIMSNHIHMLCAASDGKILADIIRDFKKYTSKKIIKTILEQSESRREWMLAYFQKSCSHLKRAQRYKVWQDGYHAEIVYSNKFIKEKVTYIHQNPVKAKIVANAEDYIFSSARNYADSPSEIEVIKTYLF